MKKIIIITAVVAIAGYALWASNTSLATIMYESDREVSELNL